MKYQFLLFLFFMSVHFTQAQNSVESKMEKPSAEIWLKVDSVYYQFSQSYLKINADMTSDCYLENALTISHYSGQSPKIIMGRKNIAKDFSGFFNYIKENNETVSISFKIIERVSDSKKVFDIGFYKLLILKDGKEQNKSFGKIAIVLAKDNNGK